GGPSIPQANDGAEGPPLDRPGDIDHGNGLAVGGDRAGLAGDRVFSGVAAGRQDLPSLFPRRRIPLPDGPVPAAGNQLPAVGREGGRAPPPPVPSLHRGELLAGSGVPQAHHLPVHARERRAVVGEAQRAGETPTALAAPQFLARADIPEANLSRAAA